MALINVQLSPDSDITQMDESLLEKREYTAEETDVFRRDMTEYWLDGRLVHSSADIKIKKAPFVIGAEHGALK